MTISLIPVITDAGLAAIFKAQNDGVEATISEIGLGDGQWTPDGKAAALESEQNRIPIDGGTRVTPTQIHLTAIEDSDQDYWINEVGFYLADGTLLAVWSHKTQPLAYKAAGIDVLLSFDLAMTALPADSITIDGKAAYTMPAATEGKRGTVQLATNAEVAAGTDDQTAVTPAKLKQITAVGTLNGLDVAGDATISGKLTAGQITADAVNWDNVSVDENLGIGTTTPAGKLHVVDTSQEPGGNTFVIGIGTSQRLRFGNHNNYAWIQSHSGKPLAINSIGNNVGIGTDDPKGKLHVTSGSDVKTATGGFVITGDTGSINVAIDNNEIAARNNGNPSTLGLQPNGGALNVGGDINVVGNAKLNGGSLTVAGTVAVTGAATFSNGITVGGTTQFNLGEGLQLLADGDYYGSNLDARIIRMIDGNGSNGEVDGGITFERYTSTDNVAKHMLSLRGNGNIGIGTTNPIAQLTVVGSGGDGRSVSIDSREIKFRGDSVAHFSIFGPDSGKEYLTIQNTSSNYNMNTAGTDLLTIDKSGNVGIGTTNPQAPLSVAGTGKRNVPDSEMHISSDCILFGGVNNGRQIDSGKIAVGLHQADSLNIVGMSDANAANRRVDMWAEGGFYVRGDMTVTGGVHASSNTAGERTILMEAPNAGNHRGDGASTSATGLVYRVENNPNNGDPIFQVRSSGEAVRFFVDHDGWTGSADNAAWFNGNQGHYFGGSPMRIPNQPAFDVASTQGVAANNVQTFNRVYLNRGGHFSTSSNRFTAPVDGVYVFHATTIKEGNNTSTVTRLNLRKNGSTLHGGRQMRLSEGSNYGSNGVGAWVVQLSAGDFVDVWVFGNGSFNSTEYTYFNGFLLG